MRNLRHLCFCYLEELLTTFWKNGRACVWSAQNATSFHVCLPLDFAQHSKTAEIFFCVLSSCPACCEATGGVGVAGLKQGVLW